MTTNVSTTLLTPKEARGSRTRCLMFTLGSPAQVADRLTALIAPYGTVDHAHDVWMPCGFLRPQEAELCAVPHFLTDQQQKIMTAWWLIHSRGASTPNWDIASTCTIDDQRGLLLVEAKAHADELSTDGKPMGDADNHTQIGQAITQASQALNTICPGWALSRDTHYQLSNRVAWAWKLASLGIPVVLVYLGFLNADEMLESNKQPFDTPHAWTASMQTYAQGIVPSQAWGTTLRVNGTPLTLLHRSVSSVTTIY